MLVVIRVLRDVGDNIFNMVKIVKIDVYYEV